MASSRRSARPSDRRHGNQQAPAGLLHQLLGEHPEVGVADAPELLRVLVDPIRDEIQPVPLVDPLGERARRIRNEPHPLVPDRPPIGGGDLRLGNGLVAAAAEKHDRISSQIDSDTPTLALKEACTWFLAAITSFWLKAAM